MPNTPYTSVLSRLCGTIPQDLMTELATALQEVYSRNQNGGHGSRKRVQEILLRLGVQPNT